MEKDTEGAGVGHFICGRSTKEDRGWDAGYDASRHARKGIWGFQVEKDIRGPGVVGGILAIGGRFVVVLSRDCTRGKETCIGEDGIIDRVCIVVGVKGRILEGCGGRRHLIVVVVLEGVSAGLGAGLNTLMGLVGLLVDDKGSPILGPEVGLDGIMEDVDGRL
jgi:hypothetical protein